MGRYSAIPLKFKEAHEAEWDRTFALAMSAMRDPNSDETQLLCEAAVDDPSALQELAAFWVQHRDAAACDVLLAKLFDRHVMRVCEDEADKACETAPGEEV